MKRTNVKKKVHKKLMLLGRGPYKIVSISPDDNTAKLSELEPVGHETNWVVNMSRIKKYIPRPGWMCMLDDQVTVGEITGKPIDNEDIVKETPVGELTNYYDNIFKDIVSKEEIDFNIYKKDLVSGFLVDAIVGGKWKCATLHKTRTQGGKMAKVIGEEVNAWISVYKLRRCNCNVKGTKVVTKVEAEKAQKRGYWKV